ncbi:hypothetical protein BDR22DRAFT_836298 [Usnea florida]
MNIKAVQLPSKFVQSTILNTKKKPRLYHRPTNSNLRPTAIMHASIVFTALTLAATVFASPALETRACPPGPYKEGSPCEADCLGALRCSDNLYDVIQCSTTAAGFKWEAYDHCGDPICKNGSC